VALLAVVAIALAVRSDIALTRSSRLFLVLLSAYLVWVSASIAWSLSRPQSILELERIVVYVALAASLLLTANTRGIEPMLAATLATVTGLFAYGLARRLFPGTLGRPEPRFYDASALFEPLGYSNALGAVAAMAALLALGFVWTSATRVGRGLAAAAFVVALTTLYLTLSRGAWIGLLAGIAAAVGASTPRWRMGTTVAALGIAAAPAIVLAARSPALVQRDPRIADVAAQGQRLAVVVVACAGLAAALGTWFLDRVQHFMVPRRYLAAASALAVALGVAAITLAAIEAVESFASRPAWDAGPTDRLVSLSGNRRDEYWSVAWQGIEDRPAVGSGAGTFGYVWLEHRPSRANALDAHNLYLETLAELGPPGLLLLVAALVVPLVAAVRVRASPFVPCALGAYIVFLVHAGVDWLWEMGAVTAMALVTASALVAADRAGKRAVGRASRIAFACATLVAAAFSFTALLGNSAVDAGTLAVVRGDHVAAAHEADRASRWIPWSPEPWRLRAEAALAAGDPRRATEQIRTAIEKDPRNAALWYQLALLSGGSERSRAIDTAERLNPRAPELDALRRASR
jgi:hypothetical protein